MDPATKAIYPTQYEGVKVVSFGYAGQGSAIMRGPMVSGLIQQMLTTADWGEHGGGGRVCVCVRGWVGGCGGGGKGKWSGGSRGGSEGGRWEVGAEGGRGGGREGRREGGGGGGYVPEPND